MGPCGHGSDRPQVPTQNVECLPQGSGHTIGSVTVSLPMLDSVGCLILGLVLLGSFLAVYFSESVVFYTDQDDEIIVYRMKDGEKKHQGYILKSTPLKDRFLTGDHTFVFESQGYET